MKKNMKPIQEKGDDCPSRLYHYTTLKALIGIIQEEKLVFWGTRYDTKNDPIDYMFANKIMIPKILEELRKHPELSDEETDYCEMFPYIVSFTENDDDESMWKHYDAEVSLEIDTDYFYPEYEHGENVSFLFGKCVYVNEDDIEDAVKQVSKQIPYESSIPDIAQNACVFIKRDAFRRENEWRIYSSDYSTRFNSETFKFDGEQPRDVKIAGIRDRDIILYKEFELKHKALK